MKLGVLLFLVLAVSVSSQTKEKSIKGFSPIDYSKGDVGKNFQGHDIVKTILALLEKAGPKKEFEKTVDYDRRLAQLETEPLIGNMKASDTFIFFPPDMSFSIKKAYDADSEVFKCEFSLSYLVSLKSDFTGSQFVNTGIPREKARMSLSALGVQSDKLNLTYYLSAPIPIKEAAQVKDRLTIAICFSFSSPYMQVKDERGQMRIDLIGEVKNLLLLDPVTGHIYKTI